MKRGPQKLQVRIDGERARRWDAAFDEWTIGRDSMSDFLRMMVDGAIQAGLHRTPRRLGVHHGGEY